MKIESSFEDRQFFKTMTWSKWLGIAFLCFQLGLVIWARFVPQRYFCWAPHDCQTEYTLHVTVNGRELNDKEIFERYRRHQKDRDVRSVANVQLWIKQRDTTYGRNDDVSVIMDYAINGIGQAPWLWSHGPQKGKSP
jgi:hypothetical protein